MPNLKESFLQQDFGSLWYPKCSKTGSGTVGGQGRKVFQILFNQTFFFFNWNILREMIITFNYSILQRSAPSCDFI